MKKHSLKVENRQVIGKKVKKLRKQGILPANIYGKDIKSTAVQVPFKDFETVYKEAGETGLVELNLEGKIHPVLIHNVQHDFVNSIPVHADFFEVNLKEKVKTMVPVIVTGEPKAVSDKVGLLLQILNQVEVEALPADLPEHLEVDVTSLAAVNDQVSVADLKKPTGVEIVTPGEETIAKIAELVSKETEAELAAEAAAAEAAKAEAGTETAPAAGAESKETPAQAEAKPKEEAKA